jgi:hypothetical protein
VELIPGDLIRFLHGVRKGKSHGSDGTLTRLFVGKRDRDGRAKVALPIFTLGGLMDALACLV